MKVASGLCTIASVVTVLLVFVDVWAVELPWWVILLPAFLLTGVALLGLLLLGVFAIVLASSEYTKIKKEQEG